MARRSDQKQYDFTVVGDFPGDIWMVTGPAEKVYDLKYGRNPGSTAAFYRDLRVKGCCIGNAEVLQAKKDPGYINIEDADRALRVTQRIREVFPGYASATVIKHDIPCGAGRGNSPYEAFENAWAGDPLSAFGGVVAISEAVDKETAQAIRAKPKVEWVIAPGYSDEAIDALGKRMRLMRVEPFENKHTGNRLEVRGVQGGYLVAEEYESKIDSRDFIEVKFGTPTDEDFEAALLNWAITGLTKSNAVVVGDSFRAYGIGAGHTSRVDSAMMALFKASGGEYPGSMAKVVQGERVAEGLVAASDAFWPFRDGPKMFRQAGVRGCIYPTGSDGDQEVFDEFEEGEMFVMIPRPEPGNKDVIERAFY